MDINSFMTKERFSQLIKGGFPFNPVKGEENFGKNLIRLQQASEMFAWKDPRFIPLEDIQRNHWEIKMPCPSVTIKVRNPESGLFSDIKVYNGSNIIGLPSIEKMSAMSNEEWIEFQQIANSEELDQDLGGELVISPARALQQDIPGMEETQVIPPEKSNEAEIVSTPEQKKELSGRYAVLADYWRGGIHNAKGIALANELNNEIQKRKLQSDRSAIETLVNGHPDVRKLGLKTVTEEEYLANHHRKLNVAEPKKLHNGDFVRDDYGAYRPKAGGNIAIQDNGDSLQIKTRSKESFAATLELAKAKGWTAIEIKGGKKMLSEIWLEAKLKGVDVVNYKPTKEDLEKFTQRVEQQTIETARALQARPNIDAKTEDKKPDEQNHLMVLPVIEQPLEQTVLHSYVNEKGENKTISVTYQVHFEISGHDSVSFGTAREAAEYYYSLPGFSMPSVIKSIARMDGVVDEQEVATTTGSHGVFRKMAKPDMDAAFSDILTELKIANKEIPFVDHESVEYSGKILDVKNDIATQKIGPMYNDVVSHNIKDWAVKPKRDMHVDIAYNNKGKPTMTVIEKQRDDAGHEISR